MKRNLLKYCIAASIILLISSCEKEVSRSPLQEFHPVNGKIVVDTKPEGSLIFHNGRNTGQYTPDSLIWLDPGFHEISLEKENFLDTTVMINLPEGGRESIFINYWDNPKSFATLKVNSKPTFANLSLNDSATGKVTPYTFTFLEPGEYRIKAEFDGYRFAETKLTLSSNMVRDIFLTLTDTSYWVTYDTDNSDLPDDFINDIAIDASNNKWIATVEGLTFYNDKTFQTYTKTNSTIPSNSVNTIKIDANGIVWIGTMLGLVKIENGSWSVYTVNNSPLPKDAIFAIQPDNNGNTWLGTEKGLVKFDGTNWTIYNTVNSKLSGDFVTCLGLDREGNIWAGTNAFGINKFDGTNWTLYNTSNTFLPGNGITAIAFDKDNVGWFGHAQRIKLGEVGGLTKFNGSFFELVMLLRNSFDIKDVFVDDSNNKWISTFNGVELIQADGLQYVFTELFAGPYDGFLESQLKINKFNVARVGPNLDLWLGSFGAGLTKLKRAKIGL